MGLSSELRNELDLGSCVINLNLEIWALNRGCGINLDLDKTWTGTWDIINLNLDLNFKDVLLT